MASGKNELAISELLHNLQVEVSSVHLTHVSLDWRDSDYTPDFNKLYFILDGEGWIRIADKQFHPRPGQLCLMPAYVNQGYSVVSDQPYRKYWCHFTTRTGSFDLFQWIGVPFCIDVQDPDKITRLFEQLIEPSGSSPIVTLIRQKAAMLELLAAYLEQVPVQVLQHRNEEIKRLNVIHDYVDKHLQSSVSVDDLASLLHLHPNYFIAYFKKHFGISPLKYVNRKRIEKAKTLLMTSAHNVKEIADLTGFADTNHFTKFFRKETGFSPTEFRAIYG
ncbi:helix-turn-helix domain-containing protein [Cohnella herbarum]|uniref:AraC family transcriptional regulator n=1 Tax=Cohnella herbarum TaxID=2728023 RepID=A0A7Z2VFQ5_9BACL|nr:AraC family transcriptional regulator [Cohnella herbarum]QJD82080.1 AraC family transcriptional regulator [Cohnella herbarum]